MCVGYMQIHYLYKGLEHLQILVWGGGSWNQSSTDTEGQLCVNFSQFCLCPLKGIVGNLLEVSCTGTFIVLGLGSAGSGRVLIAESW